MYIVEYNGTFGFIKPWSAVRDSETFSQQFLTPSIVEGMEKKLFPEMIKEKGIHKILRHKLCYDAMSKQKEVIQTRGWFCEKKALVRNRSVLTRSVLINPTLYLAFENREDAIAASTQHICLCRNEDILLPKAKIVQMTEDEFDNVKGLELSFGRRDNAILVGYNRYDDGKPMYGELEYTE